MFVTTIEDGFVFDVSPTVFRGKWCTYWRAAQRAGRQGVSPHVVPHAAPVWMAEAGIPIAGVAAYLGQSRPDVTARVSPIYLKGAAEALEV